MAKSTTKTVKPESATTEQTATGTTSYSADVLGFCNSCGAEYPSICTCCGGKLTKEKASEIHNKIAHPE